MKIIILLIIFSEILLSNTKWLELRPYEYSSPPKKANIILVINDLQISIHRQNVLSNLLNVNSFTMINQDYKDIILELNTSQYEIIFVSYLKRNELLTPSLMHHHSLYQYPLRKNKFKVTSESSIISEFFKGLDKKTNNQPDRPLCIIFHLPPKSLNQLDRNNIKRNITFKSKRDFALALIYNETFKRKYMYPTKILIFPTLKSKTGLFIQ